MLNLRLLKLHRKCFDNYLFSSYINSLPVAKVTYLRRTQAISSLILFFILITLIKNVASVFHLFMRITLVYLPMESVSQFQWTLTAYTVTQKKPGQRHWYVYQVILTRRITF